MAAASRRISRLALAIALAVAIAGAFALRDRLDLSALETAVRSLGPWGPLGFAALFAAGTVLFLPGSIFGLTSGALFGPLWGTLVNLAGGTLGATLAFLFARYLAADWAARSAGGRLQRVVDGVNAEGWRFVALVRLVPIVPFNLANYALGLTHIPLGPYVLATAVSMLPGTAAYAWLGYAGSSALAGSGEAALHYGLLGLAVLAAIAFVPRLVRRIRIRPTAPAYNWIEPAAVAYGTLPRSHAIVDVRSSGEFSGPLGHITNAINIPVDTLVPDPSVASSLGERPIILVCRTDRRSTKAAMVLQGAGFKQVSVLRGGMERWNALGLPVERSTASASAIAEHGQA